MSKPAGIKWRSLAAVALLGIGLTARAACPDLFNERLVTLQGQTRDLCEFQGKVLLVVNTASYCGYTRQYKDLQALYERYREQGLVVLGFPSNDFGRQEPGSNQEVAQFCERNFGVRFPLFAKSSVVQEGGSELFDKLAKLTGERPKWNFHKYLVNRDATVAKSFASSIEPLDIKLTQQLEAWLKD